MFVPAPLFPGARVALVGPSSAVKEERCGARTPSSALWG